MDHRAVLEKLCRVCGRFVTTKSTKTKYLVQQYLGELETAFGVMAREDNPAIHPTHFCHSCKRAIPKSGHTNIHFNNWTPHQDSSCTVCVYFGNLIRGGRPSKSSLQLGRPPSVSPRSCILHVKSLAPSNCPTLPPEKISVCERHLTAPAAQFTVRSAARSLLGQFF